MDANELGPQVKTVLLEYPQERTVRSLLYMLRKIMAQPRIMSIYLPGVGQGIKIEYLLLPNEELLETRLATEISAQEVIDNIRIQSIEGATFAERLFNTLMLLDRGQLRPTHLFVRDYAALEKIGGMVGTPYLGMQVIYYPPINTDMVIISGAPDNICTLSEVQVLYGLES